MGQGLETLRRSRLRVIGKKSSPENLRRFLDSLARIPVMAEACRQAGFGKTSAKYYIEKSKNGDPGFDIRWGDAEGPFHEHVQVALDIGRELVETCMFTRATGYKEVQLYQGRVQYEIDYDMIALGAEPGSWDAILKDKNGKPIPVTVMKQSEDLQMFIMKAHKPDIYGAKAQLDVTLKGGVMVVTGPARTSAELEAIEKKMQGEVVDVEFIEVEDEPDADE
jgi:hypothetical protein